MGAVLCTVGTYGSNDEKLRKCRQKISDVETKLQRTTKDKERKPLLRESIRLDTELLRLKDVQRDEDNMKQERARLQRRKQRLSTKQGVATDRFVNDKLARTATTFNTNDSIRTDASCYTATSPSAPAPPRR